MSADTDAAVSPRIVWIRPRGKPSETGHRMHAFDGVSMHAYANTGYIIHTLCGVVMYITSGQLKIGDSDPNYYRCLHCVEAVRMRTQTSAEESQP